MPINTTRRAHCEPKLYYVRKTLIILGGFCLLVRRLELQQKWWIMGDFTVSKPLPSSLLGKLLVAPAETRTKQPRVQGIRDPFLPEPSLGFMLTFHVNVCYQLLVFTGFVLCGTYRHVTALTRACQEERRPPNLAGGWWG